MLGLIPIAHTSSHRTPKSPESCRMCPWVTASTPSPSIYPGTLRTSPPLLRHLQNPFPIPTECAPLGQGGSPSQADGDGGESGLPKPCTGRRGRKPPQPPRRVLKWVLGGENNSGEKGRDALRAICWHSLSMQGVGRGLPDTVSIPDPSDHQPQYCSPPSPLLSCSPSRPIPIPLQPARAGGEMFTQTENGSAILHSHGRCWG